MNYMTRLVLLTAAAALFAPSVLAGEPTNEPTATAKTEEGPTCKVTCGQPLSEECEESKKVIETLRKIFEAYGRHDLKSAAEYIADDCTGFSDDRKLIVGKKAILEQIEKNIIERSKDKDSPLLSYTIDKPYAQVTGDTAIVTFVAYKSYGGQHSHQMISHCTDIFVKRDGKWLASHYRRSWKDLPSTKSAAIN